MGNADDKHIDIFHPAVLLNIAIYCTTITQLILMLVVKINVGAALQ
jgi:hypothetical protein